LPIVFNLSSAVNQVKFKLGRDLLVLSGGQFVGKVVGFVTFAYLARTLGPESYGVVEYAVGLTVFFAMMVDWGLGPIGVRELAAKRETAESLAALISGARLMIACVAIPVLGLAAHWSGQPESAVKLVWLYGLTLLAVPWKQDWLLQSREMMNAAAFAELLRTCVFAAAVVILVHSQLDILYVGVAEIAAVALTAAYYLRTQNRRICPVRLKFTPREVIHLLREAFSVGLGNVVSAFVQYAPLFLVANLVGGVALAWFGASHRVVISLVTFSWIYHWNLFPTMARRAAGSPEEFHALIGASFRVVAWGGILIALILTLAGQPLMALGFGASFAEAAPAFSVLIWTLPLTLCAGHARWALIAKGLQRYVLFAQIAGAAVVLVVGLALTNHFGAVGAAIAAMAASLAIWIVAHVFAVRSVGPMPGIAPLLLPACGAGLAALLALGLDAHPLLDTMAAGTVYVLFALLADRKLLPDLLRLMQAKADMEGRPHAAP
jgi:O-antigen/teichoic acid export membrane protein